MKTVTITADFDSYPNGKDVRSFRAGDEVEMSDAHADLLVGKDLAREIKPKAPTKPQAAEPAETKDAAK